MMVNYQGLSGPIRAHHPHRLSTAHRGCTTNHQQLPRSPGSGTSCCPGTVWVQEKNVNIGQHWATLVLPRMCVAHSWRIRIGKDGRELRGMTNRAELPVHVDPCPTECSLSSFVILFYLFYLIWQIINHHKPQEPPKFASFQRYV